MTKVILQTGSYERKTYNAMKVGAVRRKRSEPQDIALPQVTTSY